MRLRVVIFLLLAMGLLPAVASAQFIYDTPCPIGSQPVPYARTQNPHTQNFQANLCQDANTARYSFTGTLQSVCPLISSTTNPASQGCIRLANIDPIAWRDYQNTKDFFLFPSGPPIGALPADLLEYISLTQTVSDSFTGATQNPIAGSWSNFDFNSLGHTNQRLNNAFYPSQVAVANAVASSYTGTFGPNQFVQATIAALQPKSGYLNMFVRWDGTANNFYYACFCASGVGGQQPGGIGNINSFTVFKIVGGVQTILAGAPIVPQLGDVIRMQVIGGNLSVFQNGILISSAQDAALSSGIPALDIATISTTTSVTDIGWDNFSAGTITTGNAGGFLGSGFYTQDLGTTIDNTGISTIAYKTAANCASIAAPAVCGSASAGAVIVAVGSPTVTVNTTAVTANSQIFLQEDFSLGARLGVTCNVTVSMESVSARTPGTSFQITMAAAPVTNPECINYTIIN